MLYLFRATNNYLAQPMIITDPQGRIYVPSTSKGSYLTLISFELNYRSYVPLGVKAMCTLFPLAIIFIDAF